MAGKLLAAGLLILAVGVGVVQWQMSPMHSGSTATVQCDIPLGSGARAIGARLAACGVVRNALFFEAYVRLAGEASHLQAGTYVLGPAQTLPNIAGIIASGKALSTDITVTLPEGMNVWEVAATLQKGRLLKDAAAFARTFLDREGRLYPETYRFAPDATPKELADRLVQMFDQNAAGVTRDQLVIASILEKEAKTKDDMMLVSGIIQKRLQLNMPLQIDAAVAYGWCLRNLRTLCEVTQAPVAAEIKIDGPYNTYTRKGLPAGPISNPGANALWAAQHPQTSDYLYYLSTRDGQQLIYAKTLAEHLNNRSKYLGL